MDTEILHGLRYLLPWELWYYSIPQPCRIYIMDRAKIVGFRLYAAGCSALGVCEAGSSLAFQVPVTARKLQIKMLAALNPKAKTGASV